MLSKGQDVKKSFGSDNHSGVHPAILEAISEANSGHMPAYGGDPVTARARDLIREALEAPQAEVFFVFTGTAANTLAIRAACRPFEAVIATDIAHINEDECGAPEYNSGSKILGLPHVGGKLSAELIDDLEINPEDPHRVLPRLVSLTQATELGTVYSLEEIGVITKRAHERNLLTHMDGARLANAAVHLNCNFAEISKGIDILSFGGTKNGLLCGEALVFLNPDLADKFPFIRKQSMQLASKGRYLACQFLPYLEKEIWKANAKNANAMAQYLKASLIKKFAEAKFPYPTEANEVFVILPDVVGKKLQKEGPAYLWEKQTKLLRLVCSFDTQPEDIDLLIHRIT